MTSIRSLPAEERPRERLIKYGVAALSNIELLAIVIGSGTSKRSALHLAAELMAHFQTLEKISQAAVSEMTKIEGIGPAKAIQILAALGLCIRKEHPSQILLDTDEQIYAFVRFEMESLKTENLMVILRDVRKKCIHKEILSKGSLTELLVHPREVFQLAIKHSAHSILLVHNHPSGDPTPSHQDITMTERLRAIGEFHGILVASHLIIGKNSYYSLI